MPVKNIGLILLVIALWGSNFVVIKIGVEAFEPLMLLAMRFTAAGLIFIPFMKWPGWKQARMIMLVGFLMGPLHQGLLYVALETVSASLMSLIMKSNVIMVTLIGWFFLKEKVGWRTWTGIGVGFLGVATLLGGPSLNAPLFSIILAFLSAFFIALTYVAQKKVDSVHPATYIAFMSLPSAPFIVASSIFIEGLNWTDNIGSLDWQVIASVVFFQAVIISLTHMLWQRLMTQMPISQIIPWTLLIPVFAVGSAVLFLNEELSKHMLIGGLMIISGVGIVTLRRIGKAKTPKTDTCDV
ncbi:MAG: EamA family transporter [Pseudomonadota bacterium]